MAEKSNKRRELDISWQNQAACVGQDPENFHSDFVAVQKKAARFCIEHCIVREECLDYAETIGDRWGVWGGKTAGQRKATRKQQKNGIKKRPSV